MKAKAYKRIEFSKTMEGEPMSGAEILITMKSPRVFLFGQESVYIYQKFGRIPKWAVKLEVLKINYDSQQKFKALRALHTSYIELPTGPMFVLKAKGHRRVWFDLTSASKLNLTAKETHKLVSTKIGGVLTIDGDTVITRKL